MADEALQTKQVKEEDSNQKGTDRTDRKESKRNEDSRRPRRSSSNYSQRSRRYRGGYRSRRKVCNFCVNKINDINWKQVDSFRRYINDGGGMRSRRKTGTCARHQRRLAVAIKQARHMALLPYTVEHVRIMNKG